MEGLRPTPDRVRETLFNWLQQDIIGARCLDLFAGSGALGLEALSRGASRCVFVESDRGAARQIETHLRILQCEDAVVVNGNALGFLERGSGGARYDLVFLDPPFHQAFVASCVQLLEQNDWLAPGAHIYLETESSLDNLVLPTGWQLLKAKRSGQVNYHLARRVTSPV